jgi:hypothetical protein
MNQKGSEAERRHPHPLLSGLPAARAKKGTGDRGSLGPGSQASEAGDRK